MLYHSSKNEDKRQVLDSIEANFSTDTIKRIAADTAVYRGQLDGQRRQVLEEQQINAARSYLEDVTSKYKDEFQNEHFVRLYGEAFKSFGTDLNSDYFMQLYRELKKSIRDEALKEHNIHIENENAKDRISDAVNSRSNADTKDILEMTEDEIRRELKKYK